jgi:hypothetical protein
MRRDRLRFQRIAPNLRQAFADPAREEHRVFVELAEEPHEEAVGLKKADVSACASRGR